MKDYQNVIFDLDGTLVDPVEGITNGVKCALCHFGIVIPPVEELYKFIGPPFRESFSQYYGMNSEDTETAIAKYREFYKDIGVKQNVPYVGMVDMLKALKGAGKKIMLATSKPEPFAKQILAYEGITELFDFAAGASLDSSRDKKSDVLRHVLKETGIEAESSIMIGDRKHDIIGAKEVGMDSVGVLYGYGSEEELKNAGATFIVPDVMGITRLLCAGIQEPCHCEEGL
ncbi:MAG: HAD family hydrolase [Alphaproteobacteria bacterium]|nr:HAD family hydrolase [Alphaproteobacteria bacterium]